LIEDLTQMFPAKFGSIWHVNTFHPLFKKLQEIDVKCKLKTCSACQDLHALQFWSKSDYSSRS
jgi:chorismate mutase